MAKKLIKIQKGSKPNWKRISKILAKRAEGNSINRLAKIFGITKQGIWYYIKRYGNEEQVLWKTET